MSKRSLVLIGWALGCSLLAIGCADGAPDEGKPPGKDAGGETLPHLVTACGGLTSHGCQGENWCVDDPRDNCDPKRGDVDCSGICVGAPCSSTDASCDEGYLCVADPRDSCDPEHSGADCPGFCLYAGNIM